MDFGSIVETVRDKITELINSLSEKLSELMETNKKLVFLIAGLTVAVLICLILLVGIALSGSDKKKDTKAIPEAIVLEVEEPVIPDGPKLPKDYNISRPAKDKWTDEEAEEWFTVPGENEVESLSFSNDKIVKDILEAAP
jgi:uncharacterized membrane-anchored protein